MNDSLKRKLKLLITLIILGAFVWFLIINPMIIFHNNEKKLEDAAKRYFELNSNQLPTGERIKTVGLDTLYHKSFIEGDLFIPYTKKTCSVKNSWVKVRRENGEYKYYPYLECGVLTSSIDHRGPEIKLNGDTKIEVSRGEKYNEFGVKSVVDDTDGKMNIDDVVISGNVNTNKIGTYQVTYTAYDSFNNKTVVTREVEVVQKLYGTIKNSLKDSTNFVGDPENNYIRLSNIMFRVYGVDSNKNVIVVSLEDISNVNYSQVDKWLDEVFYKHLNKKVQKLIVDSKYCNMTVNSDNLDTTKCNSYTEKRKVSIPSIVEVNKAQGDGNFMKPTTMSWVSNLQNDKNAYLTRNIFFYDKAGESFLPYSVNDNYGVRPMMTIRGDTLITGGDGTSDNPYVIGDVKKARGNDLVNERFTGEYVSIGGTVYRIIDVMNDGTTKVVGNTSLGSFPDSLDCRADPSSDVIFYNPKNKYSVAYCISNKASQYIDTSYFANHEIEVPIYKNKIIYGKEVDTKKYTVKVSAPNMYDMFSAQPNFNVFATHSFWYSNTSQGKRIAGAVYDIGSCVNDAINLYDGFGVRVVGYLKKSAVINSGDGTIQKPYKIK